jgi:hypothetical protein
MQPIMVCQSGGLEFELQAHDFSRGSLLLKMSIVSPLSSQRLKSNYSSRCKQSFHQPRRAYNASVV